MRLDIERATGNISLEIDTSAAVSAIEAALASVPPVVPIEADTAALSTKIEQAVASTTAVVDVQVDSSGIDGLKESADQATPSVKALGDSGSDAKGKFEGMATGVGLARGEVGGLVDTLGPAAVAVTALGAVLGAFVGEAAEAETVTFRAKNVLGEYADVIEHVNIAGLSTDIRAFSEAVGANDDLLKNSAINLAQLAIQAGKTQQEAAGLGQQYIELSAFVAASNPTLGSASDVADRLSTALARGGRFAAQFGLDITAAEITARALSDTGKTATADLTQTEKALAGLALATERFGPQFAGTIGDSTKLAQVQLSGFQETLKNVFEEVGGPLLEPVTTGLRGLLPAAVSVAHVIGDAFLLVAPAIQGVTDVLAPLAHWLDENRAAVEFLAVAYATKLIPSLILGAQVLTGNVIAAAVRARAALVELGLVSAGTATATAATGAAAAGAAAGLTGGATAAAAFGKGLGGAAGVGAGFVATLALMDIQGLSPFDRSLIDTAKHMADFQASVKAGDPRAGEVFRTIQGAAEQGDKVAQQFIADYEKLGKAGAAAFDSIEPAATRADNAIAGLVGTAQEWAAIDLGAMASLNPTLLEQAAAYDAVTSSIDAEVRALDVLWAAQHRGVDIALDLINAAKQEADAQTGLQSARDKVNEILLNGEKNAGDLAKAEDDLSTKTLGATQKHLDYGLALAEVGKRMQESGVPIGTIRDQLLAAAQAAGLTKEETDKLLGSLGDLPAQASTAASGVEAGAGRTKAAAQDVVTSVAALQDPATASGMGIGTALILGMAVGISQAQAALLSQIDTTLNGAITYARNKVNAKSPSLVFAEQVGVPISQGIALGITQAAPDINEAMQHAINLSLKAISPEARESGFARNFANEFDFVFGGLSPDEQLRVLNELIANEQQFTDRWVQLTRERDQIAETSANAQKQAARTVADAQKQAAADTQRAIQEQISELNDMVRQEQAIAQKRIDATARATSEISRLETQLQTDRNRIEAERVRAFEAEDRRLADAESRRRDELERFASISTRFRPDAGLSASQLIRNAEEQNRLLEEFTTSQAALRTRGVSQGVVDALGLDQGPQALGQIRRLLAASQAEIEQLNARVGTRSTLIGTQVGIDTAGVRAETGAAKIVAQASADAQVQALLATFRDNKAAIVAGLATTLAGLDEESAAIGRSAGATLGMNIAAGLQSTNPIIRQAAADLQTVMIQEGFPAGVSGLQGATIVVVAQGESVDAALRARR